MKAKTETRNSKKAVVGTSNKTYVFSSVARRTVVSINRLSPDTDTVAVSNFLKANGATVCHNSVQRYIGMRVCVSQSDVETVFDPTL